MRAKHAIPTHRPKAETVDTNTRPHLPHPLDFLRPKMNIRKQLKFASQLSTRIATTSKKYIRKKVTNQNVFAQSTHNKRTHTNTHNYTHQKYLHLIIMVMITMIIIMMMITTCSFVSNSKPIFHLFALPLIILCDLGLADCDDPNIMDVIWFVLFVCCSPVRL